MRKVNWVWIDCNTTLPLNEKNITILNNEKMSCLSRKMSPRLEVYKRLVYESSATNEILMGEIISFTKNIELYAINGFLQYLGVF